MRRGGGQSPARPEQNAHAAHMVLPVLDTQKMLHKSNICSNIPYIFL